MLGLLILLAAQGVVAEDQAQFDKAWAQVPPTQAEWSFSRDAAFDLYEWTQAQFTLGYCSEFLPVADAARMRAFPNEQDLMQTRLGQGLITTGHANFDKGVAYRDKDKPDEITCIQAMAGRGEKLKAITAPRNGSITNLNSLAALNSQPSGKNPKAVSGTQCSDRLTVAVASSPPSTIDPP